jgi:hypothetical protein
MLERRNAITNEDLEINTFVLAHPTVHIKLFKSLDFTISQNTVYTHVLVYSLSSSIARSTDCQSHFVLVPAIEVHLATFRAVTKSIERPAFPVAFPEHSRSQKKKRSLKDQLSSNFFFFSSCSVQHLGLLWDQFPAVLCLYLFFFSL